MRLRFAPYVLGLGLLVAGSADAGPTAMVVDTEEMDIGELQQLPPLCLHNATATAAIDAAVDWAHTPAGSVGLIVAYTSPAVPSEYRGYGVTKPGGTAAPTSTSIFGLGSLSKLFTATLLGVASVHDPGIIKREVTLPNGVPNARPHVTYEDLADHHAGLPKNSARPLNGVSDLYAEYGATPIHCSSNDPGPRRDCGCCDTAYSAFIGATMPAACNGSASAFSALTCTARPHGAGAANYFYSNEGFSVLGHQLAHDFGTSSWEAANAKYVTAPLGMNDTKTLEAFDPNETRLTDGCSSKNNPSSCKLLSWLPVGNPAAGLFSTASDMMKFLKYNLTTTPVTCTQSSDPQCDLKKALPAIHAVHDQMPGGQMQLAWSQKAYMQCSQEIYIASKDGANGPFTTWIGYIEGQKKGVIILSNSPAYSDAMLGKIGAKILLTGP